MSFLNDIQGLGNNISLQNIRDIAIRHLPSSDAEQQKLYEELLHGTKILDDEPHLNMYLKSYGNMHKEKVDYALDRLPHYRQLFSNDLEIFDWGCGQGMATICTLDFLRLRKISSKIKRITLIEPSIAAVSRASAIINCYPECSNIELRIVNKPFDELSKDDVSSLNCRKLHIFSNILDVTSFDLADFTHLFQETQKGGNYIVCVGPLNNDYKRMDWFIEAINPDFRYVSEDKPRGTWKNNWTLALRIVAGFVQDIEDISIIRKRIEDAQRHTQMFAGFVTDALSDTLLSSEYASKAEELMSYLSMFDVKSNKSLEHGKDIDSIYAVLSNIISRGMPTKASLLVENTMVKSFNFSHQPLENPIEYHYYATDNCSAKSFFEALHVIFPKWNIGEYNQDVLESSFEEDFVNQYLPQNEKEYLAQLLEPQRPLSSIIDIPNTRHNFAKDQRVDFAMEVPYAQETGNRKVGIVVEINGAQYHSSIAARIKDAKRADYISSQNWNAFTIDRIDDKTFSENIENSKEFESYLKILKNNYYKEISGEWREQLQFALSPFAIARIEKIIIEALISGYLDITAEQWNIAVIERDVPCAAIALKDIQEMFEHICELRGTNETFPTINLSIISNPMFKDSPLHCGHRVKLKQQESGEFDICIDISVLFRDKIADLPISINSNTYYVIRSSHYSKAARKIYSAENISYSPLVEKTLHGEYVDIPGRGKVLQYFLQNIFRKHDFREGQLPILSRVLSNKTTVGLLPTGGGKSLTYQLPSMLQAGVTIVIDPLISLMVDQYNGLINQRIDVTACINSSMDRQEKVFHIGRMMEGQVQFMLLSPERFMMKEDFRDEILQMHNDNTYFSYGVIDEVHTVSEWGHDFRPAYLQLGRNMTRFMKTKSEENIAIVGLTATASFDVLADVERELTLGGELSLDSDAIVKPELSEREELTYHIEQVKADFSNLPRLNGNQYIIDTNPWNIRNAVINAKRNRLKIILDRVPYDINDINTSVSSKNDGGRTIIDNYLPENFFLADDEGKYANAGIVFCPSREGLYGVYDKVSTWSIKQGTANYISEIRPDIEIGTFIGGDKPENIDPFKQDKQNLMVATKAFGMGIDKPNVRYTINLTHPSSIESYVQEAGRAGRDKKTALSYMLHEPTEYIQLTTEVIAAMCGNTIPVQLQNVVDKFILFKDLREAFDLLGIPENEIETYISYLSKHRLNADKEVQVYFHNSSFKGAYKEKVILYELTDNPDNTLPKGIYSAINGIRSNQSAQVVIPWVNKFETNPREFNQLVLDSIIEVGNQTGWSYALFIDAHKEDSYDDLVVQIKNLSQDDHWIIHSKDDVMDPVRKAFAKRRDRADTDKAIYRMSCIGLIDDVTIDYVSELYTVKVTRKSDDHFYDTLQYFFEKYYSAEQALRKTNEAKNHRGRNAADKCMDYLAEFVYENLETKRRRAIDDMRGACLKGASMGDDALKDYIHLYFNSKYARDTHEVNGENYSLSQDVLSGLSVFDIVWKYINVMNNDPSGPEADNINHLYGAVLIILRAQAEDSISNAALYLLRSFCLACLGTNNNEALIEEFKEGYTTEGFNQIISYVDGIDPDVIKQHRDKFNDIIKIKAKSSEGYLISFIEDVKTEIDIRIIEKFYRDFTTLYTE